MHRDTASMKRSSSPQQLLKLRHPASTRVTPSTQGHALSHKILLVFITATLCLQGEAVAPSTSRKEMTLSSIDSEVFGTSVTLTTSMMPQRGHPMGDAHGSGGGGGFINQHMKLLTLLTIAIHLRVAAVILPPAASRDTFDLQEPTWTMESASSLWDIPSIAALLERYNISLIVGPTAEAPPGAMVLPSYFCRILDIDYLTAEIQQLIRVHLAHMPVRPAGMVDVVISAPDLILALRTDHLPLYAEVAKAVKFASRLTSVADGLTRRLEGESPNGFNGLHLRVEGDMLQTHNTTIASGLVSYYDLIRQLDYKSSPLYIASGIFVKDGRVDTARYGEVDMWLNSRIIGEGRASRIVNRRLLVLEVGASPTPPDTQRALHSEQRAAIDFLVLLRAGKSIGTRMSSFSFMVREFRALAGLPRETSGTVDNVWELFAAGASFYSP